MEVAALLFSDRVTEATFPAALRGGRPGRPWLALAVVAAALAAGLATPWFIDFDEAVYAEVARGMWSSGDWVRPQWNGRPFYEKPALFYWLTGALYSMTGVTPVAPRLISLLATLAGLAALAGEARRRLGARAAETAVWVAGAALLPFSLGRMGLLDALLTAALTTAVLAFARGLEAPLETRRRWLAAGYAAAGVALAAKGPAFPLLIGAIMLADAARRRRVAATLRASGLAWGVPLLLAVGVPWYLLAYRADGPLVVAQFVGKHTLGRLAAPLQGHGGPLWYYLPVLLVALAPFTALLPGAVAAVMRRRGEHAEVACLALAWAGVPLLAFSLAATKLPQYIAPAIPALALLVAWAAAGTAAPWGRAAWHATLACGAVTAVLVGAIPFVLGRATTLWGSGVLKAAPGLVCLPPGLWRYALLLAAVVLLGGAIAAWRHGIRGDAGRALRALGVAGALGWAGVWIGLGNLVQATTIAPLVVLAQRAAAELPAGTPLHLVQLNHRVTPTLATGRMMVYLSAKRGDDVERLRAVLAGTAPARVVVSAAWWEEIRATAGGRELARECGLVLVGEQ